MLVYVDESYREAKTPNCKSTFAAVCIREDKYRQFDKDFFKLKRHFFKIKEPHEVELKGRLLLSERAIGLPKNREFVRQLICLMKEYSVIPFAVVQEGSLQLSALTPDNLPALYRAVLRRVDRYMLEKYPKYHGILFFDGIDHQTNQKIAIAFTNYMFRHHTGGQSLHVLPVPNFSDSVVTPGVQLADVLAYCVNERYVEHGRRDHLEEFFLELRELAFTYQNPDEDFVLWGFQGIGAGGENIVSPGGAQEVAETT